MAAVPKIPNLPALTRNAVHAIVCLYGLKAEPPAELPGCPGVMAVIVRPRDGAAPRFDEAIDGLEFNGYDVEHLPVNSLLVVRQGKPLAELGAGPYQATMSGDRKWVEILVGGVRVKVDFDDTDYRESVLVANAVLALPELVAALEDVQLVLSFGTTNAELEAAGKVEAALAKALGPLAEGE